MFYKLILDSDSLEELIDLLPDLPGLPDLPDLSPCLSPCLSPLATLPQAPGKSHSNSASKVSIPICEHWRNLCINLSIK
jgi:hypothetical protein